MAKSTTRGAAGTVTGLALAAVFFPACGSLDKREVEEQLFALEENAPLRGRVQTLTRPVQLDGELCDAEFRYVAAGARGTGRPVVVLVHGTPSSLVTWTPAVFGPEGLAEDCEVYALEVVGHGTTRTELEDYSFAHCSAWVRAFLDALDLDEVTLVGNSYGGEFAWRAALDAPSRIRRLVLMSSSGFAREEGEWLPEEIEMRENGLAHLGWILNSRERVRTALAPHFQDGVPATEVEQVFLVCSNRDNWSAMIDLARDENGARSGELARLTQPTLLLWGADDVAYPHERWASRFASAIPDARLELVPRAGHYPQAERPAAVARAIAAFARGQ